MECSNPDPLTNLLGRFEKVAKQGRGFKALCPAHDDHKHSLSIMPGDDGRILIKCHAGCETEAVLASKDLTMKDLFSNNTSQKKDMKTYNYEDRDGKVLFQAVRLYPKDFRQRRPDGNGGWIWNLQGIKPVLYKLPEILKAIRENKTIYIVEGEKDVDKLFSIGLMATCNPMGAGKWRDHYNEIFVGAKVVIIPDNDTLGRDHALNVAENLYERAANIKILELPGLPKKGDISDWLANDGT